MTELLMLRGSVISLLIGLLALTLGLSQLGGISFETGRLIFFTFLGISMIGFVGALVSGRRLRFPIR